MRNKELFKETFQQVILSEEKFREVRNVQVGVKKWSAIKYVTAFTSIAIILFFSGNGISYAMTGKLLWEDPFKEELLDKYHEMSNQDIQYRPRVHLDGNISTSKEEIITPLDEEGKPQGIMDFFIDEKGDYNYVVASGGIYSVTIDGEPKHTSVIVYETDEGYGVRMYEGKVKEENGKTMLYMFMLPIDITEDFADGVASGIGDRELAYDDAHYEYYVEGTLEDYTCTVRLIINDTEE